MAAHKKKETQKSNREYWNLLLSEEIKLLNLPCMKSRPKEKTFNGHRLSTSTSKNLTNEIRTYVSIASGDTSVYFLACLNVLLNRYTDQSDIAFGVVLNNEDKETLKNEQWLKKNVSLFRTKLDPSDTFESVYFSVKERLLSNQKNSYPFEKLIDDFNLSTKEGRNAALDIVMFIETNKNAPGTKEILENVEAHIDYQGTTECASDIQIYLKEGAHQIGIDIVYNGDVYDQDMVQRMMIHYKNLLSELSNTATMPVGKADLLSEEEHSKALNEFNKPFVDFPQDKTLVDLLVEQVLRTPKRTAVVFNDTALTYEELNLFSNQFANYLIEVHGVSVGDLTSVMLGRSEWLIVAIIATLKAGSAYVPIDPQYPVQRMKYIQEDSKCQTTIDGTMLEDFLAKRAKISHKKPNKVNLKPTDLAYIIYTSGTTGNPKGVMIEHSNVVRLFFNETPIFDFNEKDVWTMFHSYCFDFSVWEIYGALLFGGKLVIPSDLVVRDPFEFMSLLQKEEVTVLNQTPSSFTNLMGSIDERAIKPKLRYVIFGGEALYPKYLEKWNNDFPSIKFINMYGITETTVHVTYKEIGTSDIERNISNIGRCIPTLSAFILNTFDQLQPVGLIGELCISGSGLARGYLNRPELTDEKFVVNPITPKHRMYRSGDLARWLPDGDIEYIGRKDDQVKIRGHRIELGEIEAALNTLATIKQSLVLANSNLDGEPRLVAYLQAEELHADINSIRLQLEAILPDFMMPSFFMWVDDFPINKNGKIDKKKLPAPEYIRLGSAPLFKKPRTDLEKKIAKIWAEQLMIKEVGIDDNFFEMGGTSLLTQKVSISINKLLKLKVPVTKIYQYPTIATLTDYLVGNKESPRALPNASIKTKRSNGEVAIIGMAGRFPGANTIDELWDVLKEGKETISFFKKDELDSSIPEELRNDSLYVGARGIVPSARTFDADFFGINKRLAEVMDPQQRLFLEIAWEALEQSGHLPEHYEGRIGVYAGTGANTYYKKNILPNKEVLDQIGHLQADTVNEKDYISSRTAYHLDLKGPAVSVHSACSTSLLAVAEATEAIRSGQCEVALAGGSSITAPMFSGHLYQEGSMLSTNGHCRPFDADAKGTVFSDGAGLVLLKELKTAKEDGNTIYGIIKGVGINNDGRGKGSFTAPSTEGQANAIRNALHDAGISPDTISYVEAHGTATPLGDPIEIEGLKMAFGEQSKKAFCGLGSIKSNMGHLTAAAGVAGLIKTILALHKKQIPPSLGFTKPNPAIDFENSPFFVNDTLTNWEVDGPRRAGISSFGVGGTNVHVVVEEYDMAKNPSDSGRPLQILPFSAKTETSLDGYGVALKNYLDHEQTENLADVAFSLATTRGSFGHRRFMLAETTSGAAKSLDDAAIITSQTAILKSQPNEIGFLFPGQGAQYLNMGRALYEDETVFRESVDECALSLMDYLKKDIRKIIFSDKASDKAEAQLRDTRFTQPALFVIEYALSKLWMSWGIRPTFVCGHSIGEFVGAHLAGIFSLKDALLLIAIRGKLVSELPGGSMLTVRLEPKSLEQLLPDALSIAAINSDKLCVVSGPDAEIEQFSKTMKAQNIPSRLLSTSHAFHSNMMNPVLGAFGKEVKKIQLNTPQLPIVSSVTGTWLTDAEATDPEYWINHLYNTVRFSDAMDTILQLEDVILLEVGPGHTLTTLANQKKGKASMTALTSLALPKTNEGSHTGLLKTLGQLWLKGLEPDWLAFYAGQARQELRLPSYVFDRKPCWIAPLAKTSIDKNPHLPAHINVAEPIIKQKSHEPMRKTSIFNKISELVSNASGIDLEPADKNRSFLELGLDSLILTQIAITFKKEFKIPITFRQLNEEFGTPELLAEYLNINLPEEATSDPVATSFSQKPLETNSGITSSNYDFEAVGTNDSTLGLIQTQLQILGKQIELLQGNRVTHSSAERNSRDTILPTKNKEVSVVELLSEEEKLEHNKPFGAAPRIESKSVGLDNVREVFLNKVIARYNKKTQGSKNYAQENRAQMADPRVVSGFKPLTKELIYPLVIGKSSGNRLWDIDGNEYIDALNGFGSCFFGYQPDFIKKALHEQIELGYEVGPQHPLAGEVCELLREFTGHERAALCNTGSEAVLGAMRIARTVTGRSLIVAFTGSYHGINDEGIVRGSRKMRTFPAAAGILPEAVQNMLILDYGTEESARIIRERALELAAVLVEPVQSRKPELRPVAFLREIREITNASETALIFDEVITGFRMHPGGAQALFNIRADIATYGKVIGAGVSIGAILGNKEYMDALDGGFWQYGDDSYPEIGVTYFAGTFVRHPLALASTKASLNYMKEQGPSLQKDLSDNTEAMVKTLNSYFQKRALPMEITYFGSLWRLKFQQDIPFSELFFVILREKGIHIWDGFPCFLTTAYTQKDIDTLINAVFSAVDELVSAGIFSAKSDTSAPNSVARTPFEDLNTPPSPGAKLGRDKDGKPAWFIEKKEEDGGYIKIEL